MRKKRIIIVCLFILGLLLFIPRVYLSNELDEVLEDVRDDYDVAHISNEQLRKMSAESMMIFDVRKLQEYQVSHIQNAIHLDPNTTTEQFLSEYATELKGKTAVFYCSVGLRSSKMLEMLSNELAEAEIAQAYNLDGGAFKWHNDKLDFIREGEKTQDIHPYNDYWGRLIDDKSSIKYE